MSGSPRVGVKMHKNVRTGENAIGFYALAPARRTYCKIKAR